MRSCAWALVLMAAVLPAWGQMYKCVDKNGVTRYADAPLPDCKGREVDIRPIAPLSGGEARRDSQDFAREDADFKRRKNERATIEAQQRAALESRCTSLRRDHAALSSGRRLARVNEQGETVYVSDEVREQRLARVRQALRACP